MVDIIHFHPSLKMAKIFVNPLIEHEKKLGYKSILITKSDKTKRQIFGVSYLFDLINFALVFIKNKPKIIIAHNSIPSLTPLIMGRIFMTSRIVYFNHGVPFIGHTGLTKLILHIIERLNCIFAKEIITVSEDMKKILNEVTNKKVLTISNGSACGIVIDKSKKNINRRHSLSKNEFHIGYVGRKNSRKGYNLIVDLWKQHYANKDGYKLFIYGTTKIKPLDLKYINNIFFMGFCNKINYSNLNCVLLPSKHEGLSYTCIESIAEYCPIIGSNIPGIREVISHKQSGILVENICVMDFFLAIENVVKRAYKNFPDKECCDRTVQKYCRNKFLKHYSVFLKKK
jgi:glycosyltransferase involved in cell wall biosynthesis|tara:strand:+ start:479 stop:1504 length:1026 start_codon:yes stop_codon:yes gene_type:complete